MSCGLKTGRLDQRGHAWPPVLEVMAFEAGSRYTTIVECSRTVHRVRVNLQQALTQSHSNMLCNLIYNASALSYENTPAILALELKNTTRALAAPKLHRTAGALKMRRTKIIQTSWKH